MRIRAWLPLAAGGLMLAMAPAALAAAPPTSAVLSNGVVALGVGADGGLSEASTGVQFLPSGVDGMLPNCACAPTLRLGSDVLTSSPESFTFTSLSAASSELFQDTATGGSLRLVQQFAPAASAANLYEVVVTVENTGASTVDPTFVRPLAWANQPAGQPIAELELDLGQIAPGGSQVFREYFGVGSTLNDASNGFAVEGATPYSETFGEVAFAYGYGLGAAPAAGGGGGGGGGGAPGNSHGSSPVGNSSPANGNQPNNTNPGDANPSANNNPGIGNPPVNNSPGDGNPPVIDSPISDSPPFINDPPSDGAPGIAPRPS